MTQGIEPGMDPQNWMTSDKLQLFVAGLGGLAPDEVRKAKVLFIRNAISEYRAYREQMKATGCVQAFFAIIPFFWPILYAQRRQLQAVDRLMRERINNALEVWKDDLGGERFEIPEGPEQGW